jgi:hypothetical protein
MFLQNPAVTKTGSFFLLAGSQWEITQCVCPNPNLFCFRLTGSLTVLLKFLLQQQISPTKHIHKTPAN